MGKKPFTTRIDEDVLAAAQKLAQQERRSVTSVIEVAVLEYAARKAVDMPGKRGTKTATLRVGPTPRRKTPGA